MPPMVSKDTEAALPGSRPLVLLPWNYGCGAPVLFNSQGATLVVSATGRTLTAARLEVDGDSDPEKARYLVLGSVDLEMRRNSSGEDESSKGINGSICSITKVKTSGEGWCISACDNLGYVTLIFIDIVENDIGSSNLSDEGSTGANLQAKFRQCPIFSCFDKKTENASSHSENFLIRAASVELLASVSLGGDGSKDITVWSGLPRISCSLEKNTDEDGGKSGQLKLDNYISTTVPVVEPDLHDENNYIVDFRWVSSGSLDAFPWLVTFTRRSAIVHRRPGKHTRWVAVAQLYYPTSGDFHSTSSSSQSGLYEGSLSPADAFPHLIPALQNIVTASDERKLLRSDWHPESIMAYICTEEEGAKVALQRNVQGIFSWLSQWMKPDETTRPIWHSQSPLGVTPLRFVMDDKNVDDDDEENADNEVAIDNAASLMSSLARPTKLKPPPTDEELLLTELQSVLCPSRALQSKESKNTAPEKESRASKRSKEFQLAMAHASLEKKDNDDGREMPPPLQPLSRDEIRFLWAIGETLANPPKFKKLDPQSQLAIFCVSLMRHLERAKYDEEKDDAQQAQNGSKTKPFHTPGVLVRQSFLITEEVEPPVIASAGCLSALLSNTQTQFLSACRKPGEKMDWTTARSILLPFWLRSDDLLQKISEEIAQSIYKQKKDILECALFYIIIRKSRSLRNMAATDRSESGKKFLKDYQGDILGARTTATIFLINKNELYIECRLSQIEEYCAARNISPSRLCSECDHKAEPKGAWMEIAQIVSICGE